MKTSQYVTADVSGNYALSAARSSVGAWELFNVALKSGTTDQYTIYARGLNKNYVQLNANGALMPSAANVTNAASFRLLTIPSSPVQPNGTYILQEVSTSRFVSSTNSRPSLFADLSVNSGAASWVIGANAYGTTLQNSGNSQFASSDPTRRVTLSSPIAVLQVPGKPTCSC